MKKYILLFLFGFATLTSISQEISGPELLDKAIAYHDPADNWSTFDGQLRITMETPDSVKRVSRINIDLISEYFYVRATKDANTTEYTLSKDNCIIGYNGRNDLSEETLKKNNLSCERARLFKNYYTYLYGLPMKLKDPGTIVNDTVERKSFKEKEYLVLKVTYDEAIGSDVWFFYFDPDSYAMEIYQFFKGDPEGDGKDTGEYILLSEEVIINDIKMPKVRAWYYNKDDEYLGTDILTK